MLKPMTVKARTCSFRSAVRAPVLCPLDYNVSRTLETTSLLVEETEAPSGGIRFIKKVLGRPSIGHQSKAPCDVRREFRGNIIFLAMAPSSEDEHA